jgi:hypothetical protein
MQCSHQQDSCTHYQGEHKDQPAAVDRTAQHPDNPLVYKAQPKDMNDQGQ